MKYYAHTAEDANGNPLPESSGKWQLLADHLREVARRAAEFAAPFGGAACARLAGIWHDLGKFSQAFQNYIGSATDSDGDGELDGSAGRTRGPDHSTAGAQHAKRAHATVGPLISYLIAGHHSGLPNGKDSQSSCLEARLTKPIEPYIEAAHSEGFLATMPPFPTPPGWAFTSGYSMGFFLRMSFSSLVDADCLDTEAHMSPNRAACRQGQPLPPLSELKHRLDQHFAQFGPPTTPVNHARAGVLNACRAAATQSPGLFSLTVPTGGGKTLASLAFALDHALRHGMERVIYVMPFTSIIEQNAAVFRDVFASIGPDIVVEHHSNLDSDAAHHTPAARLATENWDARIVVTTNVQFFESLHAARPSSCRKLHRLSRSVIILDEAQTLPITLLKPCLKALEELGGHNKDGRSKYGTSVVLCTATQPAIIKREDFPSGLAQVREIIPNRTILFETFSRVRVIDLSRTPIADTDLARLLARHPKVLCIVNTRHHARSLFELLPEDGTRFHLSALMCPEHRSETLGDPRSPRPGTIRYALRNNLPCRVVATQLIEAGVDVDFPVVYRSLAGLDSIAQAAGRCNREGKLNETGKMGETYVFSSEHGTPKGSLREAADTAAEILPLFAADPLGPNAIESYFRQHYWRRANRLDAKDVLGCFPSSLKRPEDVFGFRFKDCAERFKLIDSGYEPVIIPWGDRGRELVAKLRRSYSPVDQTQLVRRLQRYVVQIPPSMARAHLGRGLVMLHERFLVLDDDAAYDAQLGLHLDRDCIYDPEFTMV